MGRIQRLPEGLANKIAAGEVVQRPSSVIKELVENAIDAGADAIAVTVKNAGKSLIYIADNGSGMSEEDARLAFERHATSKISTQEDLDRIMTLGFRGEALAAISSVAQVELRTREQEEELGTVIRVENGTVVEATKDAVEKGTSIAVKNLFFSVPARRKFLKSNATEFKHISEAMQAFALSYPGVAFTFSDNDTLVMAVEKETLEERVGSVYNQEMINALLPFEAESEGVRVHGFIGRPNFARKSKADQYLFMNGRAISSKLLSHAVFTGYEHLLDKQSYPPYILFLEVNPERVDVNVHPAKSEVKFDDEQAIYALLQGATRQTLSEHDLTPGMQFRENEDTGENIIAALRYAMPAYEKAEKFPTREGESHGSSGREPRTGEGRKEGEARSGSGPGRTEQSGDLFRALFIDPYQSGESGAGAASGEGAARSGEAVPPGSSPVDPPGLTHPAESGETAFRSGGPVESEANPDRSDERRGERREDESERVGMWQVHNKYIITQIRSGIMIVDQHVAHERILYEQALRTLETSMPMSQQLLFPLEMKFPPAELALINELRTDLSSLGFEISVEPGGTVRVHGVPIDVRSGQEEAILKELLDQYREYMQMGKTDQREMLAASFACRASIKAGDYLSEGEMLSLVEALFSTSMPYVCPHGRPTVTRIDLKELDRRFGRTS